MDPESLDRAKVPTQSLPVRIYTNDFEIEGYVHVKPGGYYSRVSDILNAGKIAFLPLTQVRYRLRTDQPTEFMDSDCIVIKVGNIELLDFIER